MSDSKRFLADQLGATRVHIPRIVIASAVVGVAVGALVSAFEYLTVELLLENLLGQPLWFQAVAPALGLTIAAASLRWLGNGATPSTSDEYVRAFHDRHPALPLRELPAKMIAGVATIGFGGSVGLEGPSIYAGASVGHSFQKAMGRLFRRDEAKILLTAGAAAGVAAIFKAPATGVMFALEAPYRDDVARRALLPALLASAAGFLAFAGLVGTEPVFPLLGATERDLNAEVLLGGVVIGLIAGLAARGYGRLVSEAKQLSTRISLPFRLVAAGIGLGALTVLSDAAFEEPVTLGPGFEAVAWLTQEERGLGLIAGLFVVQLAATLVTIAGGGTGGLFIPLAVQGIIMGSFLTQLVGSEHTSLYPTLGLAAFLGAGYRVPIAAVMFVAESTGATPYVVPALIAAAMSQLVAGSSSVAFYQRDNRSGHLETRFGLPLTSALSTDVLTVPSDATAEEFVFVHVLGRRVTTVAVVDEGIYKGTCDLDHIKAIDRDAWADTPVAEVLDNAIPTGSPSWTLRDAVAAMDAADIDMLPIVDRDGGFIGVVYQADIVKLDEILDETGG